LFLTGPFATVFAEQKANNEPAAPFCKALGSLEESSVDRVKDKVCIVTGAASGLGAASARLLAGEGARLVLADIDDAPGEALAAELSTAIYRHCDVTSEADWRALFDAAQEAYGGVDVLVNNAGIAVMATIESTSLEQWERVQTVNSTSIFLGCKHAVAAMKAGGGSIINMSSMAALVGVPLFAAYTASKGAVRSLTKTVALHCQQKGYGIRCNSIHPGGINTPMGAKALEDADAEDLQLMAEGSTMGEPEDVGWMVVYLASDESRHVNGVEMVVDDGFTAA
jgi:3(or 17)beta-hydroxysteroid dehydrogenase